jgi:phage-related protein
MKPVAFLGDSLKALRGFPKGARQDAGYQIDKVQRGGRPDDFKPMPTVGKGVEEMRIWADDGAYRVMYLASREEAVYVLHAFRKKSEATSRADLALARKRYAELPRQPQNRRR